MKKFTAVFLVFGMLLLFAGCSIEAVDDKLIVGRWTCQSEVISGVLTETEFVFNEDGTGSVSTLLGIDLKIEYTLSDGKISITTDTPIFQKNLDYSYEIGISEMQWTSDGKTLTLNRVN